MYTLPDNDRLELALVDKWLGLMGQGCVVLADQTIVMINEEAGRLLGVDAKVLVGHLARSLATSLDNPMDFHLLVDPVSLDGQAQCSRSQGNEKIHIQVKATWVDHLIPGDSTRYRVIGLTDISSIVHAEQETAVQHRRWQALNAGVVIVSVDEPDLPIIYVNPAFEQLTGYTAKECIGRNCRFLQGNLQQQPGLAAIRQALLEKRSGYAVLRNFRKDGTEFLNELFISPIFDATNNKLTHFIGVQHLRHELPA